MKRKNAELGWIQIMIALMALALPACQTAPPAASPDPVCRTEQVEKPEARPLTRGEPWKDSKTLAQVEKKMKRAKGEQILVSKRLLRALLNEDRLAQSESSRLGAQLEALKKVDLNDGSHTAD